MRVEFKYAIGDRVEVSEAPKLEALITCASVDDGGRREYRIVFWHDAARRTEWVHESELRPVDLHSG